MTALAQSILLTAFAVCGAVLGGYWIAFAIQLVRTVFTVPTARRGLHAAARRPTTAATPWPSVCVIVPAHNEEAVIATVARSLIAQDYRDLRFVFSLDRCTDATARVLREALAGDPRAEIVEVSDCPRSWAGKVHAIWRGVEDSRLRGGARAADLLLFIDADTTLQPACTRACVALLEERGLGMLSLLSTLSHGRWFERLVQPPATMELVRQYPITRANSLTRRRPLANGQFILFRRDVYDAVGGHAAVHDAILEDIQLARRVAHHDGGRTRAGLFLAGGLLHCRMYGSWAEFRRGWKRIYVESTNRRPSRMRAQAIHLRLVGTYLPAACSLGIAAAALCFDGAELARLTVWVCAVALAVWLATVGACYAAGRTPPFYAVAYPLGAWLVAAILREAAADLDKRKAISWGGREYILEARESPRGVRTPLPDPERRAPPAPQAPSSQEPHP